MAKIWARESEKLAGGGGGGAVGLWRLIFVLALSQFRGPVSVSRSLEQATFFLSSGTPSTKSVFDTYFSSL